MPDGIVCPCGASDSFEYSLVMVPMLWSARCRDCETVVSCGFKAAPVGGAAKKAPGKGKAPVAKAEPPAVRPVLPPEYYDDPELMARKNKPEV